MVDRDQLIKDEFKNYKSKLNKLERANTSLEESNPFQKQNELLSRLKNNINRKKQRILKRHSDSNSFSSFDSSEENDEMNSEKTQSPLPIKQRRAQVRLG